MKSFIYFHRRMTRPYRAPPPPYSHRTRQFCAPRRHRDDSAHSDRQPTSSSVSRLHESLYAARCSAGRRTHAEKWSEMFGPCLNWAECNAGTGFQNHREQRVSGVCRVLIYQRYLSKRLYVVFWVATSNSKDPLRTPDVITQKITAQRYFRLMVRLFNDVVSDCLILRHFNDAVSN